MYLPDVVQRDGCPVRSLWIAKISRYQDFKRSRFQDFDIRSLWIAKSFLEREASDLSIRVKVSP